MDDQRRTCVQVTSSTVVTSGGETRATSYASGGSGSAGGASDDSGGGGDGQGGRRPGGLGDLRGVIPIGQTQVVGSIELSLLALELYEHGFVVTSRVRADRGAARAFPEVVLEAEDDQGGSYRERPHGGSGDEHEFRAAHRFDRPLDATTRHLNITAPEVRWRTFSVDQPHPAEVPPTPGPWRFTVSLPVG